MNPQRNPTSKVHTSKSFNKWERIFRSRTTLSDQPWYCIVCNNQYSSDIFTANKVNVWKSFSKWKRVFRSRNAAFSNQQVLALYYLKQSIASWRIESVVQLVRPMCQGHWSKESKCSGQALQQLSCLQQSIVGTCRHLKLHSEWQVSCIVQRNW